MAAFKRSVAACPEFISHRRHVKIEHSKLKYDAVHRFPAFYTAVSIVRYNTRSYIRRLSRFGSGKAGIAAMA